MLRPVHKKVQTLTIYYILYLRNSLICSIQYVDNQYSSSLKKFRISVDQYFIGLLTMIGK